MRTYFISCRVYRKDQQYWTLGVKFQAERPIQALDQYNAWAGGMAIHPNVESIVFDDLRTSQGDNRFQWTFEKTIFVELEEFLAGGQS